MPNTTTPYAAITKIGGDQATDIGVIDTSIDQVDAALRQPFYALSAVYDSIGNQLVLTIEKGRALFAGGLVVKATNTAVNIAAPIVSTTYYVYFRNDATFVANLTGVLVPGQILLWSVATANPLATNTLVLTDLRQQIADATSRTDDLVAYLMAGVVINTPGS